MKVYAHILQTIGLVTCLWATTACHHATPMETPITPKDSTVATQPLTAEEDSICTTARGYLTAVANFDMDAAAPYATAETREHTIPLYKHLAEQLDTHYLHTNTPATVRIDSLWVGDTVAYAFFTTTRPLHSSNGHLMLLKQNSTWLAHVATDTTSATHRPQPPKTKDLRNKRIQKGIPSPRNTQEDNN